MMKLDQTQNTHNIIYHSFGFHKPMPLLNINNEDNKEMRAKEGQVARWCRIEQWSPDGANPPLPCPPPPQYNTMQCNAMQCTLNHVAKVDVKHVSHRSFGVLHPTREPVETVLWSEKSFDNFGSEPRNIWLVLGCSLVKKKKRISKNEAG